MREGFCRPRGRASTITGGIWSRRRRSRPCSASARKSGPTSDESDLVRAFRRGSQDSINSTGQQIVRRQLNIQPTLTIRQGFPVRVIVNRDLVLAPYGQQEASR